MSYHTLHTLARRALLPLAAFVILAAPTSADIHPWSTPDASWTETDWDAFGQNLVAALASENEGLKLSALQMVVHYGDRLDVRDAAFDVVRLFQDHEDQRVRRLAAVACGQLKSGWALGFLRMSEPFERDARVRATIRSIVQRQALLSKVS